MLKNLLYGATAALSTHFILSEVKTSALDPQLSTARHALAILYPHGESGVTGLVSFSQENITSATKIVANVKGLKPNSNHGFHIHEYGDLTQGCATAGIAQPTLLNLINLNIFPFSKGLIIIRMIRSMGDLLIKSAMWATSETSRQMSEETHIGQLLTPL